ncbi:MAG TPA: TM2 domain-containing protein [Caldisericia bacterium]|nr:TM2 domain-containing protein [Caldisericia bacterium]HPF49572.1 TM2 domain-containing protein [Caldisericia bacterium]HPI84512.1 TM2 domain-containing protein [Caldisericia bacterium]HPQ93878.1 TM2 domain-containing protein [Caldisericia bacterium]HRV75423.1 TM2 domain-containing protein [Caldisericia bacterium]
MANYPTDDEIIEKYSREMSENIRTVFASEYHSRKKNTTVNFLLVFFLGRFGAHKIYMEQIGMFVLYFFTAGLLLIGSLYDLFTYKAAVFHFNDNLARDLRLKYLRVSKSSSSSFTKESSLPGYDDVFSGDKANADENGDDFDPFE